MLSSEKRDLPDLYLEAQSAITSTVTPFQNMLDEMPVLDELAKYFEQEYGEKLSKMPHLKETAFIIVQHGFKNTGPMLEVLFRLGVTPKQIFISTKPQTTSPEMLSYLTRMFDSQHVHFIFPESKDRLEELTAEEYDEQSKQTYSFLLEKVKWYLEHPSEGKTFKNLIVCDEGGRFLTQLFKKENYVFFEKLNIVAIEHTNCGTRAEALFDLNIPYISMAKSYAKLKIESLLIARAVFRALENTLDRLIEAGHTRLALVGLGNIGQGVLTLLANKFEKNNDIKIVVYDNKPSQYHWLIEKKSTAGDGENKWHKICVLTELEERDKDFIDINAIKHWASIFLGCAGSDIFDSINKDTLLEDLAHNIGEVLETFLFSCSSGQREFKSALNQIKTQPDKCRTDINKVIHYLGERDSMLSVFNLGFPTNFSRDHESSLTPREAQLTNGIKLAAIIQALYIVQLLPTLRYHPEASKWLTNFTHLTLQEFIIKKFCEAISVDTAAENFSNLRAAIAEAKTEQSNPDNFSQDKSSKMPTEEDMRKAYFHYLQSEIIDEHSPVHITLPRPGSPLQRAIRKIMEVANAKLHAEQHVLDHYLPLNTVARLPENKGIAEFMNAVEVNSAQFDNPEHQRKSINDMIEEYLAGEEQMLLLLGDPGAGKSTFILSQIKKHLTHQIYHQPGIRWLPIIIEMRNYSLTDIPGLLDRFLLQKLGLTSDELSSLKTHGLSFQYKILVVLEGFDEQKSVADKFTENLFQDCVGTCLQDSYWGSDQVKFITTCRSRYLSDEQQEIRFFAHAVELTAAAKYSRHTLLLFSQEDILKCLSSHINKFRENNPTEAILSFDEHLAIIKKNTALNDLVRNPLILKFFVEALPELQRRKLKLDNITRYDIYDAFISSWFLRETQRLNDAIKITIGLPESANTDVLLLLKNTFIHYAILLAGEMYRQNTLAVSLQYNAQNKKAFDLWRQLTQNNINDSVIEQIAVSKLTEEYERSEYITESQEEYIHQHKNNKKAAIKSAIIASLEAFKSSCPLQQIGDLCQFFHKSLYEFFLVKGIVLYAGSEKDIHERVHETLQFLGVSVLYLNRRIQQEPEALHLLNEIWIGNGHEELFVRIKNTLFKTIEASRNTPDVGPAAANAVTILNWMGVMLTDKKWQNINIPGAYLPYAILLRTDLSNAFLEDVNLLNAQLTEAKLTGVRGKNILFSDSFGFNTHTECSTIAHHPTKPWIAVGHVDGTVRQLDLNTFRWIGEKYVGHNGPVIQIIYAPNGCRLTSLGADGKVVIWNQASTKPIAFFGDNVTCIAYSPRSDFIALGTKDGLIQQIRTSTNTLLISGSKTAGSKITSACYSYDNTLIISGNKYGDVNIFSLSTDHLALYSRSVNFNDILNRETRDKMCELYSNHDKAPYHQLMQSLKHSSIHKIATSPIESVILVTMSSKDVIYYNYATKESHILHEHKAQQASEQLSEQRGFSHKGEESKERFLCFTPIGEVAMLTPIGGDRVSINKTMCKKKEDPYEYFDNDYDISGHNTDTTYAIFHSKNKADVTSFRGSYIYHHVNVGKPPIHHLCSYQLSGWRTLPIVSFSDCGDNSLLFDNQFDIKRISLATGEQLGSMIKAYGRDHTWWNSDVNLSTGYRDYHKGVYIASYYRFKYLIEKLKQDNRTSILKFRRPGHLVMDDDFYSSEEENQRVDANFEELIEIFLWHAALSTKANALNNIVTCIAYSESKKLIASISSDFTIALWKINSLHMFPGIKTKPKLLWHTRTNETVLSAKDIVLAQPGDLSPRELSMLATAGSTQAKAFLDTARIPETITQREGDTFINKALDITGVSSLFGYNHRLPKLVKLPEAEISINL